MQALWALWGCEPCQNWGWVSSRKLVYNRTAGLWRAQWSCALVVWIKTMAVKAGMVGVSSEWWMWWIWGRTTSSFTYTLQQGALRRHRIDNFGAVSTCFSEIFSICFYSYSVFRETSFSQASLKQHDVSNKQRHIGRHRPVSKVPGERLGEAHAWGWLAANTADYARDAQDFLAGLFWNEWWMISEWLVHPAAHKFLNGDTLSLAGFRWD